MTTSTTPCPDGEHKWYITDDAHIDDRDGWLEHTCKKCGATFRDKSLINIQLFYRAVRAQRRAHVSDRR